MAKKLKITALLLATLLTIIIYKTSFSNKDLSDRSIDVSRHVERLGIPYEETYPENNTVYARNVWDLQAFGGKLYIGAGNSSNRGPAVNAGPVPVMVWNPRSDEFETEFMVDDEQIDTFYPSSPDLYIPGHDPTESWQSGNIYRLAEGQWQKYRSIPNAIHVYALSAYKQLLLAGLSLNTRGKGEDASSGVGISADGGKTWQNVNLEGARIYGFLQTKDSLYSTDMFLGSQYDERLAKFNRQHVSVYEFDGESSFIPRQDLSIKTIFPGFDPEGLEIFRIAKPQDWRSGTVYIGGKDHNDHQLMPFGLFYADDLSREETDVRQLEIPDDTKPWDLIVKDDTLYVLLASDKFSSTEISVIATPDLQNWQTILKFSAPTFARSLAILDGDFYFGLGSEIKDPFDWQPKELSARTGELLRVKREYLPIK